MPWEQRWTEAPKDASLRVHQTLPSGVTISPFALHGSVAFGTVDGKFRHYHFCRHCGGWVEGEANGYPVNTLAPLSGRQGTEYFCRRCGQEIAFFGMMA